METELVIWWIDSDGYPRRETQVFFNGEFSHKYGDQIPSGTTPVSERSAAEARERYEARLAEAEAASDLFEANRQRAALVAYEDAFTSSQTELAASGLSVELADLLASAAGKVASERVLSSPGPIVTDRPFVN